MASSKEYLQYVLDQLSLIDGISHRAMMGEYIIYINGKVAGGIFDDRFLIKPTPSAKRLIPNAVYEIPYEGAKQMILVDDIDDREFLKELIESMQDELPEPVKRKGKRRS